MLKIFADLIRLGYPFVLIFTIILSAARCTRLDPDANRAVFHGTHKDAVKTWDPANAYDTISLDVVSSVYETLYQYSYLADPIKIVPLLASDMPIYSKDKLSLKISIQRGIKFQDDPCFKETNGKGRELKSHDFIYGMKRLALPALQSQGWWIFDGKIKGMNGFYDKLQKASPGEIDKVFETDVEGLRALDDTTIQIQLNKPYPQLLYILAMSFTAPIPREAVKHYGDEKGNLTDHPVGTGPFILKKWDRESQIVLERNPHFRAEFYPVDAAEKLKAKGLLADAGKPLPFLDKVQIQVMKEDQPRWLSFLKGRIDLLGIPKDNFNLAISHQIHLSPELAAKGLKLHLDVGVAFYYVSFNTKDKLIGGNKYLRQALSSAINRDKWIEIFTNGRGVKMVHAVIPGLQDRPAKAEIKYDFDLNRAKDLLSKAGYPGGKNLPVLKFDLRGADSVSRQLGEFFETQLGAIGVKINVIQNTFPAFLEKQKQGDLQVSVGGWSLDYPDAENIYQLLYGPNKAPGPNEANFDHAEMNKLYEKMAISESGPERAQVIQQMETILDEECPWAKGYYVTQYELSQPWLLNYRMNDIILSKYKYLKINREMNPKLRE